MCAIINMALPTGEIQMVIHGHYEILPPPLFR